MSDMQHRILIIAGSDPSGGAGIQADIKTVTMLGHYAMTAVTALTVQNTAAVQRVEPASPDLVADQIAACVDDIGVDAVKIGMLGGRAVVEAVATALQTAALSVPVVLDPVMVATSGGTLMHADAVDTLKARLMPLADIITPNLPEAEVLAGQAITSAEDASNIALSLMSAGAGSVLVKGGHARIDAEGNLKSAEITDILFEAERETVITKPRIDTRHTHGTGCTLSTALACFLAEDATPPEAFAKAHAFVRDCLLKAPGFGAGSGPLGHARAERG